jgi:hypothetical protein
VPVILDESTRIVPGLIAQVNHGRLKQCEATEEGFLGPPNFVLDVFDGSESSEYKFRRTAFEKAGVTEYVAIINDDDGQACHWNRHDGNEFQVIDPDENGVIKSMALPGLWFSTTFAKDQDRWSLVTIVEYGMTRLGHHEFMETIWHKEGRKEEWGNWMPFESG